MMVKFRKRLCCLICIVFGLFISTIYAAQPEQVTINVWDWLMTQSKFIDNEINLFEKEYPYIKVKRTKCITSRYQTLIELAARSSSLPDVFLVPKKNFVDWARAGYFYPLDKWADQEFIKRFPAGSFVETKNMFNKKIYSYPWEGPTYYNQFYLNASVFKKAGLVDRNGNPKYPKTWKQARQYAKYITRKGQGKYYGWGMAVKPEHMSACFYYEWARQAGARGGEQSGVLDMDLKTGLYDFTHPGFLKMFDFILGLKKDGSIYPGYLSMDDETLRAAFADGKIAMIMGGIWNQQGWASTHPDFTDYDCMMPPPYDRTGYKALADFNFAAPTLVISSNTKHPEEAWKYLEWFARVETGIRYVEAGCGVSIFAEANRRAKVKTKQMKQYIMIGTEYAKIHPDPFVRNPELVNVKWQEPTPNSINVFFGILSGIIREKDIPKVLKDMEDRYNEQLRKCIAEAAAAGYKVSMDDLKFPDWNPLVNYEMK